MRTPLAFLTLAGLQLIALAASADVCIKQRSHTDEFYYGGHVTPAENRESELWLSTKRLAYVSDSRHVIVDLEKNSLTFLNKLDSTYVEAELPFTWPKFVPEDLVTILERYRTRGTVEPAENAERIQGWDCQTYDATSWIDTDEGKYNESDSRLWVTRDLPIDWQGYHAMNLHLLKLLNYDEELVAAFASVAGFVVRMETERYIQGFSVKSIEEVIEVVETPARDGVYSVPAGYTRKEALSMADLRG